MKPETRLRILLGILVLVIVATTNWSVLSPAEGWIERLKQRYQQSIAVAPCESNDLAYAEVMGYRVEYPACYSEDPEVRAQTALILVDDDTDYLVVGDSRDWSLLSVMVNLYPESKAERLQTHFSERHPESTPPSREGPWTVWIEPRTDDQELRTADLLSNGTWVSIGMRLEPHLAETELAEFVHQAFERMVESFCLQNDLETTSSGLNDSLEKLLRNYFSAVRSESFDEFTEYSAAREPLVEGGRPMILALVGAMDSESVSIADKRKALFALAAFGEAGQDDCESAVLPAVIGLLDHPDPDLSAWSGVLLSEGYQLSFDNSEQGILWWESEGSLLYTDTCP